MNYLLDRWAELFSITRPHTAAEIHSALVHFPLVLAILGPLVCLIAILSAPRQRQWIVAAIVCHALLGLFAYFAIRSGTTAASDIPDDLPKYVRESIIGHSETTGRILPLGLGAAAVLLVSLIFRRPLARRAVLIVAIGISCVTLLEVGVTARRGHDLLYAYGLGVPPIEITTHRGQPDARGPRVETQFANVHEKKKKLEDVRFETHVAPFIKEYCAGCHAGDDIEGDLDLSSYEGILAGGKSAGPAIIPGDADASPLLQYVMGTMTPRMPKGEMPLDDDSIAMLRNWIESGAPRSESSLSAEEIVKSAESTKTELERLRARLDLVPRELGDTIQDRIDLRYAAYAEQSLPPDKSSAAKVGKSWGLWSPNAVLRIRQLLLAETISTPAEPPALERIANPIDAFIEPAWETNGLDAPDGLCDDITFVRRVHLDLFGVVPDYFTMQMFQTDPAPDKRTEFIRVSLRDGSKYANHWVTFWQDLLGSRPEAAEFESKHFLWRKYYGWWLLEALNENRPADVMALELFDRRMPNYQGRFVLSNYRSQMFTGTADAVQVFMGTSLGCAQCHNHFDAPEFTQRRFTGMAAFFSPEDVEIVRCENGLGVVVSPQFLYETRQAQALNTGGRRPGQNEFGQLLIDPENPMFARTIVNRVWKQLMGSGLSEPADDLRHDDPPNHAALWDYLAAEFVSQGYDLKWLIELIMTSRTYQRPYNAEMVDPDGRTHPQPARYFRSPAMRRMTAEQFVDSVRAVLGADWAGADRAHAKWADYETLLRSMGWTVRDRVVTERRHEPNVLQAFELLVGDSLEELIYTGDRRGQFDAERAEILVTQLYTSAYSRTPTPEELAVAVAFLEEHDDAQTLGDLVWSLVMNPEFLYIR